VAVEGYGLLLESAEARAVLTLDATGLITTWNAGAERILGYEAVDVVGQHASRLRRADNVAAGSFARDLQTAAREGSVEGEAWCVRKGGSLFRAHLVIAALRAPDGQLVGFVLLARDLSGSRGVDEDRELLARLREAGRAKDALFSALSHELRGPMNVILGWATLLQEATDIDVLHRGLTTVRRSANAQLARLDEILDMSRVVSENLPMRPVAMDLSTVIRNALDAVRPLASAKGVSLTLERFDDPVLLVGDGDRLSQVAWNLLSNAVKFTEAGGRVFVSLCKEGAAVQLSVRDDGPGIDPGRLAHLFEPFRGEASTTRGSGLGLGLAIARHIVERHGGRIFAASEGHHRGATFSVTLPIRALVPPPHAKMDDEEGAPSGRLPEAAPFRLDGVRVLVVEDEADARELLELLLRERGAIVESAARAEDARRWLASSRADLIISDIGMPEEDGYAFLRTIRSLPEDAGGATPAIALTAYSRTEDRLRALAAGYSRHLAKPIERTKLLEEVHALLQVGKRQASARGDAPGTTSSGSN
jgi:PAS domain S-box-containing protein